MRKKRIKVGRLFTFVFGLVDYRFVNAHPVCRRCRKGGSNPSYYGDVSFIYSVDMGTVLEAADRQPTYFCNDSYLARWYYGSRHNSRLRY